MKPAIYFSCFARIISLALILGGKITFSSIQDAESDIIPNRFIIEVGNLSDIPERRSLERSFDVVYSSLAARGVDYEVIREYDVEGIFVGAALSLKTPEDVEVLQNSPGIIAVHPVRMYKQPELVTIEILQDFDLSRVPPALIPHILTETDKAHAKGLTGKGIKVGIIDSGIDYNHPSLGGGFGPGYKVIGGYDFVGDEYTGRNDPIPDTDPMDCSLNGHGTHVAGIVGANPNNIYNVTGVAYGASLASYRVFGCVGVTSDDLIIDALLMAVKDGMDVINLSISRNTGWSVSPISVVAGRIAESGIVLSVAASNRGDQGGWFSSAPANGIGVVSVASSNNYKQAVQNITVYGIEQAPIPYFQVDKFPVEGVRPLYATSTDHAAINDGCNPLPDNTPDLSEYVVLIRRGGCTFTAKLKNAAQKGARAAIIYNNESGVINIDVGDFVAILIRAEDGENLSKYLAAGASVSVEFTHNSYSSVSDPEGGEISSFSSYGPSYDLTLQPSLTAPGGNIVSTYPLAAKGFALASGTSMAAPFFAGASALFLEAHGKSPEVARSIKQVFQTTSFLLPSSNTDGDPLVTAIQQGAGLINVNNALFSKTVISPAELLLNDTAYFKGTHTITITNVDSGAKEYRLRHVPAGTAMTIRKDTILPSLGVVPLVNDAAAVEFDPPTLTVQAGQSQTVIVRVTAPTGLDPRRLPVYSGYIQVESETEKLHATYLGVASALRDQTVIDNTDYLMVAPTPIILGPSGPQRTPRNYTFVGNDYPVFMMRLAFGTPYLRLDVVESTISFVPSLTSRETLDARDDPVIRFPNSIGGDSFAQVNVIGTILTEQYVCRHVEETASDSASDLALTMPVFENRTRIPNGQYRFLLRVLKVTGDPVKQEDYESWLSPIIGIQASD